MNDVYYEKLTYPALHFPYSSQVGVVTEKDWWGHLKEVLSSSFLRLVSISRNLHMHKHY